MEKRLAKVMATVVVLKTMLYPTHANALTWADVRSAALVSSPTLQSARAQIDSADANVDSARGTFLPRVNSSLSATRSIDTELKTASNTYVAGLSLEHSLFAFGKSTAQLSAAKASKHAAVAGLSGSSVTLRAKLAKAWSKSLYLRELVKITARNISRREANYQIVKLRYSGGRENMGSVLKTESATLKSKTDSHEATANLALSRGELSILIGRDINPSETFEGSLDTEIKSPPSSQERRTPEIIANESKLQAAEESLKAAQSRYLPELTLSASAKKSASPDLPLKDPAYAAGVTLTVPLFNPSTSADVKSAAAQKTASALALAEARATQIQKVKVAITGLDIAKQRLQVALKSFDASKLQAEVSRQRYTLGLMSFQDWDSFENELIRSELEVLQAQKDTADALADYHEAIGVTLEEEP